MRYGATLPPEERSFMPLEKSPTRFADRYCVHKVTCSYYKKSKKAGNTVGFEEDNINVMKEKLLELQELPGGIEPCSKCLEGCINFKK